jgi:hypothetical protein
MLRTLALSAVAAAGLLLMPGQATTSRAAPSIAPKITAPESAIQQVRSRGGGSSRGISSRGFSSRSFSSRGHSFRGGRSYSSRSFGRSIYGGRSSRRSYAYYGGRHHRHSRRNFIIGAGFPFFYGAGYYGDYYGGSYYGGCDYYYRKWMRTGSRYWRNRYYDCRY